MKSTTDPGPAAGTKKQISFKERVLRTHLGYQTYMRLRWGRSDRPLPVAGRMNRTLKSLTEVNECVEEARRLRLPPCEDAPKTWDTLAAVREVLDTTDTDALVLDAGAETYSRFLPWMYLYGYRNLCGINLVFDQPMRQGPILYDHGDITKTRFANDHFHAIACLSVVEHGVELDAFFAEMSRILRPGGVLITSTDYFETSTDTAGLMAYGVPIRVFDRAQIQEAVALAKTHGLELTGELDLSCQEKVVRWHPHQHEYTFIVIAMKKVC